MFNVLISPANERLSSSEASQSEAREETLPCPELSTGLVSAYNVYCIQTGRCHVLCPPDDNDDSPLLGPDTASPASHPLREEVMVTPDVV